MAFEDAETLAYTLSRIIIPGPHSGTPLEILKKWEHHRTKRIAKVMDFTSKNGALRKSSPHIYEQSAKEWLIWAIFKLQGEKGGAEGLYSYNCESVLSSLC
jgi:2-polyprenyl-6-methoxyphenol hydroxylase-like FAD-dependent oxidoreductase